MKIAAEAAPAGWAGERFFNLSVEQDRVKPKTSKLN
jgi:hypothetical protein